MKRALITGISGQIGSHLAELLLTKGYEVHGTIRPGSDLSRLVHLDGQLVLHDFLGDNFGFLLQKMEFHEVYNLAAASSVANSWKTPVQTADSAGLDVARLLQAVRLYSPRTRFYQASSSEMFGKGEHGESSPVRPSSPYAAAKAYGHHLVNVFRQSGTYAVSGICFNCEGPRRGKEFVTRKISLAVGAIKRGEQKELVLGNLGALRDWGYAGDYVKAMWLSLQQDGPDDYVIATGVQHSVADFCALAFFRGGLDWKGFVKSDPAFTRPIEVDSVVGDPRRTNYLLDWKATTTFEQLVGMMVDADLKAA